MQRINNRSNQSNPLVMGVKPHYESFVTRHVKRNLIGIAESVDRGQPELSAQGVHGRNFSRLADFLCIK